MNSLSQTLVLLSLLLAADPALAQYASGEGPPDERDQGNDGPNEATDSEARSLYDAGTAAFSDGRFEDALNRWREAYELSERPELLYNIATALDRLGRGTEAMAEYEGYLEAVPDARNANYVRRRIEVLQEQLRTQQAATEEPENEADSGEPEAVDPPVELEPTVAPEPPSRAGPIALFSVAGAAAVAGVVTAFVADDRYDALDERCPSGVCPADAADDRDALRRMTRTTDALLGAALLSAVGGVVWWFAVGGEDEYDTQVACGLGRCDLRLRF